MQAKDILQRAGITLQDANFTRWPLTELLIYLNDGMDELALHKPNAVTDTVELTMCKGTWQKIADTHISLIRVTRNLTRREAHADGRAGGPAITPTSRATLDLVMPDWQNPNVLPYSATVQQVIQDEADLRSFYVLPGNDGTGVIEAVVSVKPTHIETPQANHTALASYATTIVGISPIWKNAITDYVLYRAFLKDTADPTNAARANVHYQQFAGAVGIKVRTDAMTSVGKTGKET